MSLNQWIGIALLAIVAMALESGLGGIMDLWLYLTAPKRHSEDVSRAHPLPPSFVQRIITQMSTWGFHRLGELSFRVPLRGTPIIDWVLLDAEGTTWVDIFSTGKSVALTFNSGYSDDALAQTTYPTGERIAGRDFRVQVVSQSLERAYQAHLQLMADFGTVHGALCRLQCMEDFLYWVDIARVRYAQRRMRPQLWRSLVSIATFSYALIAGSMAVLTSTWRGIASEVLYQQLGMLVLLIGPSVVIGWLVYKWR